jgi:hypothetical protein
MAETILSPGVVTNENDQSFISQQPIEAGAAIIGPTVKGPVERPTIVTTYSEYVNKFGTSFISGSQNFTYFTSISAYNYFNNGGTSLLVTRVTSGSFTPATSSNITNNVLAVPGNTASFSLDVSTIVTGSATGSLQGFGLLIGTNYYGAHPNTVGLNFVGGGGNVVSQFVGVATLADTDEYMDAAVTGLNLLKSSTGVTASYSSPNITLQAIDAGTSLNGTTIFYNDAPSSFTLPTLFLPGSMSGGTPNTGDNAFTLETLSEGSLMNNTSPENSDGSLPSGSADNVRWQIISPNTSSGTFTLLIRRGDDDNNSPVVLETWDNLSLDPVDPNYIEKIIGNQTTTIATDGSDTYLQLSGNYQNQSKYVRVKEVVYKTPNYLDNAGNPVSAYTSSIPVAGSGSFGGALGTNLPTLGNYYENISNTSTQGLVASEYVQSINLLSNKDTYQFKYITAPGLVKDFASHASVVTSLITMCQERGDTMAVVDMLDYNANITEVVTEAATVNSSYAATYWPWVQTVDPNTGQQVWVPASTMIPSIYAFTDSTTEPWFAPAGINRGILSTVIKAERILTQGNRDTLYQANINPIATFPNTGVAVFGQKTLQKKKSALDRVNVRRLLIELKNTIKQVADNLVFEQNTIATRNDFLSQVNPYLASVQQRQGLYSYRVVMDDTNNTPTVIDNNQLVGAIYIQPVKTAEFIVLDFNVTSTGVTFD